MGGSVLLANSAPQVADLLGRLCFMMRGGGVLLANPAPQMADLLGLLGFMMGAAACLWQIAHLKWLLVGGCLRYLFNLFLSGLFL